MQHASAAYECHVKVIHVLVYSNGMVNIAHNGRNEFTVVCNLNSEWKGVSVTTCAVWLAMLESIKKRNGTANFYYEGNGACENLPTYGEAPAPVYIGDMQS